MRVSDAGIAFLTTREGVVPHEYQDSAGLWTIGVGHLCHPDEHQLQRIFIAGLACPFPLTPAQCTALLAQDLGWAEQSVSGNVTTPLTQNEFDCLASFTFNVGTQAFRSSTLLKKLNAGDYQAVPDQLRRWTRAGGKVDPGLVHRREKEIRVWLGFYDR